MLSFQSFVRLGALASAAAFLLVAAGCDSGVPDTCPAGTLAVTDIVVGDGQSVDPNSTVSIYYVGRLGTIDGAVFDSTTTGTPYQQSLTRLVPGFRFGVGGTAGTTGLPEGIAGMRLGGRRQITIPPNLGYGAQEIRATDPVTNQQFVLIPSCSTLVFDVTLIDKL